MDLISNINQLCVTSDNVTTRLTNMIMAGSNYALQSCLLSVCLGSLVKLSNGQNLDQMMRIAQFAAMRCDSINSIREQSSVYERSSTFSNIATSLPRGTL